MKAFGLLEKMMGFGRKPTPIIDWGHSHPKEELILAALPDIMADEAEKKDENTVAIEQHLKECKACAEVCCGFVNKGHLTRFAA